MNARWLVVHKRGIVALRRGRNSFRGRRQPAESQRSKDNERGFVGREKNLRGGLEEE